MNKIKNFYNMLLENGDLEEVCPKATGEWEKDKTMFKQHYDQISNITEQVNTHSDSDYDLTDEFSGAF